MPTGALPMTRKQIVTRFHLLVLGFLVAITATAYVKIPAGTDLPVHWGLNGTPDWVWPRNTALLIFPTVAVLLTALFALIGQFAPVEKIEPGRYVSEALLSGLLIMFDALQIGLLMIGLGSDIDMVRIVGFGVALVLLLLGATLPTSEYNAYAGVRLPWTFRNAGHWRSSHRVAGILCIIAGLGLGVAAWLFPDPGTVMLALLAAVFMPLILAVLYSVLRSFSAKS
jgi:uncharacterized membrane protein